MDSAPGRLVLVSVICHALVFAAAMIGAIFAFSLETVLNVFQWEWIVARASVDYLGYAPVAQAWAVLVSFGLLMPMSSVSRGISNSRRFSRPLITVLVIGLVFTAGYLIGRPVAHAAVERLEFTTEFARELDASARRAAADGDYRRAEESLTQYLALVGEDLVVADRILALQVRIRRDEATHHRDDDAAFAVPAGATAVELVDRATIALRDGDYSTAHFMAVLARALAPRNDDAARIAADSLARLASLAPSEDETQAFELFRRKMEAKRLITERDNINAFHLLIDLSREYPGDRDVLRYRAAAAEAVQLEAVLRSEAEQAFALPGIVDIVFVNRSSGDRVEFVSIGELVVAEAGLFVRDVEVFEITVAGVPTYHAIARYGKLVNGHLVITVVDDDGSSTTEPPVLRTADPARPDPGIVPLGPSADDLVLIGRVARNVESAPLTHLIRGHDSVVRFGLPGEPLQIELIDRFIAPFFFVALSIVMIGAGWRLRSRYLHRPPLLTLLVLPVIPFVLLPIVAGLASAQRYLAAAMLPAGFGLALVGVLALQAGILFAALLFVALTPRQ